MLPDKIYTVEEFVELFGVGIEYMKAVMERVIIPDEKLH